LEARGDGAIAHIKPLRGKYEDAYLSLSVSLVFFSSSSSLSSPPCLIGCVLGTAAIYIAARLLQLPEWAARRRRLRGERERERDP
jgi:hypothetical protein